MLVIASSRLLPSAEKEQCASHYFYVYNLYPLQSIKGSITESSTNVQKKRKYWDGEEEQEAKEL